MFTTYPVKEERRMLSKAVTVHVAKFNYLNPESAMLFPIQNATRAETHQQEAPKAALLVDVIFFSRSSPRSEF